MFAANGYLILLEVVAVTALPKRRNKLGLSTRVVFRLNARHVASVVPDPVAKYGSMGPNEKKLLNFLA
jgi:hypothetical protein